MKELYFADQNRYDNGMEYELISEALTPMSAAERLPTMHLIMVSPTLIWLTTTDQFMAQLKRRWAD